MTTETEYRVLLKRCIDYLSGPNAETQETEDNLLEELYAAIAATAPEQDVHPDDKAVNRFAVLMKWKLANARDRGKSGWQDRSWTPEQISAALRQHVDKGDPIDVANYCMFLAARGEPITPAPAHAWPGQPTELGWWPTAAGKATSIRVDGAVMLDREMREWTQSRHMYLYFCIAGWHVMIGQHFCTLSCNSPEDAILDAWNSGEYDDLEKCAAIAKVKC